MSVKVTSMADHLGGFGIQQRGIMLGEIIFRGLGNKNITIRHGIKIQSLSRVVKIAWRTKFFMNQVMNSDYNFCSL